MVVDRYSAFEISRSHELRYAAFSLVEVLISLGLLTLVAGSVSWSFSQLNFSAASNRLYTCAETIAQTQIDAFLAAEAYSPRHIPTDGAFPRTATPLVPAELAPGTTTLPVNIYSDPSGAADLTINGTLTRTVTDLAISQNTNGKVDSLDLRGLTVTIAYTFRGRDYQVSLSTIRASDFER